MVVGGGVVLSASYEARRYGVRSGMPTAEARRLCPDLIVATGRFADYTSLSEEVFEICRRYTPVVEPISIDEAFLDIAGARRLFGDGGDIARAIRRDIRAETGLDASVGVARTKFLAKIASRVAKPDGLLVVPAGDELPFLHGLGVNHLWGVGPVTQRRLATWGIATVADLAHTPERALAARIGPGIARHLRALAWNRDPRAVELRRSAKSVGAQSTFGRDVGLDTVFNRVLYGLSDRVGRRLRAKDRAGRTLTARVRFADFQTVSRAITFSTPTAATTLIYRTARRLVGDVLELRPGTGLRLLGLSVSKLQAASPLQLSLPLSDDHAVTIGGTIDELAYQALDRSVDEARGRFGNSAVGAASVLLGPGEPELVEGLRQVMAAD